MKPVKTHRLDPSILRAYDVRGLVGQTLSAVDCYFVGRAFGTVLRRAGGTTAVLGFDGRESSPGFAEEVQRGLNDSGINVEMVGLGPTPMIYFALKSRKLDAAVMVTGSHSPLSYNGIKMALADQPFYGDAVQELGALAAAGDFAEGAGTSVQVDVRDDYVARLAQDYTAPRDLSVAWDNGNGAGGEILRRLVKKLPGRHVLLFDEIDARFPNHHPDPTVPKNMVDLQKAVAAHHCDLGVAFDGDADRFGAVDEKGTLLSADTVMALYAAEVLKHHPGAPIIADVKSSRVLFDEVARLGGQPVMWSTGHSLIKAKMREMNAPLAGELSGHICFGDHYYGYDDGIYCAVRLLNIVSAAGKPLSALTAHLPHMVNTPEVRFHVPADRKFAIPREMIARLKGTEINDIDGVRATTPDGWWLVRASNTEELLSVRAEAFTPEGLERLKKQLNEQLRLSGVASPF